jgi:hypothetical protein
MVMVSRLAERLKMVRRKILPETLAGRKEVYNVVLTQT